MNGYTTHCKRGHKFTRASTYTVINKKTGQSWRRCRICATLRMAKYRMEKPQQKAKPRNVDPLYYVWSAMKQRCTNPNTKHFHRYGGRGITYDPAWDNFGFFVRDVGLRPTPQHTLDRIDNDKGYFKENCRWATRKTQAQNRSRRPRCVHGYVNGCQICKTDRPRVMKEVVA